MALSCGEPRVVFVDEPTTGVDVGTRRFIWDRIKEAARDRVVVLTTHYMDEADALASRIGIMAAGKMRILGSPQHLKNNHGGGYRLELKVGAADGAEAAVKQLVQEHFHEVKLLSSHDGALSFEVAQGFAFAKVFAAFEQAKGEAGLETFTMSQTTLEDVFLRVAEQNKVGVKPPARKVHAAPVPERMDGTEAGEAVRTPELVRQGYYVNKCWNVWMKLTPDAPQLGDTTPPGYTHQCACFMLQWVVPIPCCCCEQHMVLVPDAEARANDEQDAEVYQTDTMVKHFPTFYSERHVWKEPGTYVAKSFMGNETYSHQC
mmetsp:Transcript_16006/g.27287  ORF Transcript_16006/g.27287 Transcript_16006/m.27287 type:complete len:317 (+) Transcript_16006:2500-3450(+)